MASSLFEKALRESSQSVSTTFTMNLQLKLLGHMRALIPSAPLRYQCHRKTPVIDTQGLRGLLARTMQEGSHDQKTHEESFQSGEQAQCC